MKSKNAKDIKKNINPNVESNEVCTGQSASTLAATNLNLNDDASTSNSQESRTSNDFVELDVRNLPNSSTSGYETRSSDSSSIEEGAVGGISIEECKLKRCSVVKNLEDQLLELKNSNPSGLFTIPKGDVTLIEAEKGIILKRYVQYSKDSNTVIININENCTEVEKIKIRDKIKKYYAEKWIQVIPSTIAHIGATGLLTGFGFWNAWGLIPRLINPVVGINLDGFLKNYLASGDFEDDYGEKMKTVFQVLEKLLNIAIIAGTATETAIFNFNKLSAEEQNEFSENFLVIFSDKVFMNYISGFFTLEQILGILHNVFAGINIFTKNDNKFTNFYSKMSDLTRASLVIAGFAILTADLFNGTIVTENDVAKTFITVGIQSACFGAYVWLGYILKDIKDSVTKYLNNKN